MKLTVETFLQSCSAVGVTVGMEEMGDCRKDTGSTGSDALGGDKNNQREESDNKNIYGFMLPHTDIWVVDGGSVICLMLSYEIMVYQNSHKLTKSR